MSAETIVKKRGRPKKIVSEPIEVELQAPEVKKVASRAKSTTAAPKPTKPKAAIPSKVPVVKKSIAKPAAVKNPVSKPIEASAASRKTSPSSVKVASSTTPPKSPITPENSKILQQVKEISAKSAAAEPSISKTSSSNSKLSQPTQEVQTSKAIPTAASAKSSIPQHPKSTPAPISPKSPPQAPKPASTPPNNTMPKSTPKIPLAAFNSAVVSNISERAGARPNTAHSKAMPQNYNTVARKVTFAIVAMPIAIVTSYVLYQRLVLGEDRKLLIPAEIEPAPVESSKSISL